MRQSSPAIMMGKKLIYDQVASNLQGSNSDCYRFWEVIGGIEGETCLESNHSSELWCKNVTLFPCADRTILCNPLPSFLNTTVQMLQEPETGNFTVFNTSISLTCPNENFYFDYSVPANLVSFFYSTNINETTLTCNKDG